MQRFSQVVRVGWTAGAVGALGLALAACGSGAADVTGAAAVTAPSVPAPATPSAEASGASPEMETVLSVDFDEATGPLSEGAPVVDDSIRHMTGTVLLGGTASQPLPAVEGREGMAVRFPARCEPNGPDCAKGIVEFGAMTFLNPGDNEFRYGATVLMTPEETSKGSNVVQKGFSTGGRSQWKLQVDGSEGRPSCVLVGLEDDQTVVATATAGVADGSWHQLTCERVAGQLVLLVDGEVSVSETVPDDLVIEPPGPVRVGGKGVKADNDQFFGVIDDVFVEIADE